MQDSGQQTESNESQLESGCQRQCEKCFEKGVGMSHLDISQCPYKGSQPLRKVMDAHGYGSENACKGASKQLNLLS